MHTGLYLRPVTGAGVSFVVPVFNKAAWLPSVLQSIADQAGDFDREYIFIDDGSTDGSGEILRETTRDWPNCQLIFQENQGAARANNRALECATMPYVKFVDADDILVENATETLLDVLHGSEACVAWGDSVTYGQVEDLDTRPTPSGMVSLIKAEGILLKFLRTAPFNPSQALVRRDLLEQVGRSDERIRHSQDYTLFLGMAARWPFVHVDGTVVFIQTGDPGRLTARKAEQQQEATMALALFLSDHPGTSDHLVLYACRRAAKRALLHARRRLTSSVIRERYWAVLRTYLPGRMSDPVGFIKTCAMTFEPEARRQRRESEAVPGVRKSVSVPGM